MKAKYLVLTFALAAFCTMPGWAKHTTGGSGTGGGSCKATNVPVEFIVAPQAGGGISGDGVVTDSAGDTIYQDGVGGVWAKFQVCRGTYDFVLNLVNTSRYLNLDFSNFISGSTAKVAVPKSVHQTGLQINDMDNLTYTNGTATTCSGMMLNSWNSALTYAYAWFKPASTYYVSSTQGVPGCNGGTGPTLANTPNQTSAVQVTQVDACTYTVTPVLTSDGDGTGNNYPIIGVAEVEQLSKHKTQWVAGGQYIMPFSYEVKVLGCTP